MKTLESLRVLSATILYITASMFWAMVVIFIFMLVFSIFLGETLREFILSESLDLRCACGGTESMAPDQELSTRSLK